MAAAATRILVNGVELAVRTAGAGAHAVLCMSGALTDATSTWGPQLAALADSPTFQLVAPDPRGYGASRPPERDFPADYLQRDAADAAALMTALGFERFSVVGHSDGANAAALLAAAHPDRVHRLVLCGGNAFVADEDMAGLETTASVTDWSSRMRDALAPLYGGEAGLQALWTRYLDGIRAIYADHGGEICAAALPEITAKTLVVHGAKDPLVPDFHAEYMHERIMHTRLHVFPEGKHLPQLQFADEFNAMLEGFLLEPDDSETESRAFVSVPQSASL